MNLPNPLRLLRRSPLLWLGTTAMLAVGVGFLVATVAVVNAALFRLPPFRDAGSIAMLYLVRNPAGESPSRERWSFSRIELLRRSQRSFDQVANYTPSALTLTDRDESELARGEMVSPDYFQVLRVTPVQGRLLDSRR